MKLFYYKNYKKEYLNFKNKYQHDEVAIFKPLSGINIKFLFIYIYIEKYQFWFRIFNYGMLFKKKGKTLELFSERNKLQRFYSIFNWKFKFLK